MSWPDPRIWCNQVGSLGGTLQTSATAATTAGLLAADSTLYGARTLLEGVAFITQALKQKKAGMSAQEIVAKQCTRYGGRPNIVGYARPLVRGDERVVAMARVTADLGFAIGEHLALAYEIQDVLLDDFDEGMNINGYISAFLSDQGFSAEEIYSIAAMCVHSGVMACYLGAHGCPPESFLPLRCDDIDYQGKPPRSLADR
jgi:citrate synthase